MDALLDDQVASFLESERGLLTRLHAALVRSETDPATAERLADLIEHLDALFLVLVVGEFNAGKSSVLNALFGEKMMEEGPIPTTARITILKHGDQTQERVLSTHLVERRHPSELLRYLNLVDTPGTNSIVKEHQQITEEFLPRADLVLFVTSVDRPLSESERQFLEYMRSAWGKRLVFVLNKIDLFKDEADLDQVLTHIRSGTHELMKFDPRIFPVSADLAYAAKHADKESVRDALWAQSRFGPLEAYITEILAGPSRLTLKLQAPLDTGQTLLSAMDERIEARADVLEQDEQNLSELDSRLEAARQALQEGYGRHITEVENLLLEMERRGIQFLDDTIRIGSIKLLRDRDQFKEEFVRQVVRDTDRQIEDQVTDAVDGLLKQALALWNETLNVFAERVRDTRSAAGATGRGEFMYNRAEVFNAIMKEARRKIDVYDLREEARRILENAREAVNMFFGAEAVAAGIGAIAAVVVTATAVDVTGGFIAAGVLAVIGLLVLPRQKRKAIREFKDRVEALRTDVKRVLTEQLDQEIEEVLTQIQQTMEPYAEFVRQERATVDGLRQSAVSLHADMQELRAHITDTLGADNDAA
ncbi:MAG: dynamin family protein [Bacteroidota bacterium]